MFTLQLMFMPVFRFMFACSCHLLSVLVYVDVCFQFMFVSSLCLFSVVVYVNILVYVVWL